MKRLSGLRLNVNGVVGVAAVLICGGTALADTFPWTPASGSTSLFTYANGRNEGAADLYQNPTLLDFGFAFNDTTNFEATGGGGVAQSTANVAFVEMTAVSALNEIIVIERGTWGAGPLDDPTQVFTLQADVTLQTFVPSFSVVQHDIDNEYLEFFTDGTWEARGTLIPTVANWQIAWLNLSNTLAVKADAAPGSFFRKDSMTVILPEPTSLGLLLVGSVALMRRRRSA